MKENVYTVSQVNNYIKSMFEEDFFLKRLSVKGEVSNCKYHTSGHIYFSLKDQAGSVACVMFAGDRSGLAFRMKNGDKVLVKGSAGLYERDGKYQIYVKQIRLEGFGELYEQFLNLKQELEDMGMFAVEYKQRIPMYCKRIGIVTASTGAAIWDIRNIAYRRNPFVELILYPALVQGDGAKESIVKGIKTLDDLKLDVLIVGRGGGSIEDLWAFNEECVARAIFECKTPVISAVGHETDTTIADYAADLRAPTPSAAAELAVTDIREILGQMQGYQKKIEDCMQSVLLESKNRLSLYQTKIRLNSPKSQLQQKQQTLSLQQQRLCELMEYRIEQYRQQMILYIEKLKGLSPLEKLGQGYSYTSKEKKNIISVEEVQKKDLITVQVFDGQILAEVLEVKKNAET